MVKKVQKTKTSNVSKDAKADVPTVLSLVDHDQLIMSDVQKEILKDEIDELPPIKEGELNVSGIYAYDLEDKLEVKAYIRNGYSKSIALKYIPFILLNSKGDKLAYQMFNLEELGEIPSGAARPVKLYFEKKNVYVDKIPLNGWKIAFDARLKALKKVKVSYQDLPVMDTNNRMVLESFLDELPDLNEGEFSISKFSIGLDTGGHILATIIMRNATSKPIKLEKMPVSIKDQNGNVVKSNIFELNNFVVNPLKAKMCNFVFPTNIRVQENISLDDWEILFKSEPLAKVPKNAQN
ncbi:SLAP domain-containing protein [Clostridium fermenticellae]|uniref:SLAP domain-containing protein n=1 Tax=Clostridium fermenticellae TaxID=2068654 RepID=A0A386H666_9CLOT|nr:SLAP domain-containing protein [Clostridium fermenticellae]AYD41130.1 SLAP domain-containing protein [Clostridium fermenticellae]